MTPEKINAVIAEFCGWKFQEGTEPTYGGINIPCGWINPKTKRVQNSSPNYFGDLNACAEMEKVLTEDQCKTFFDELCIMVLGFTSYRGDEMLLSPKNCFRVAKATAPQRCEAYLRVIGQWKDLKREKV